MNRNWPWLAMLPQYANMLSVDDLQCLETKCPTYKEKAEWREPSWAAITGFSRIRGPTCIRSP